SILRRMPMSHFSLTTSTTIQKPQQGERDTILQGRRLILAWIFWGMVAIFELGGLIDSIFGNVVQLQVLCTTSCTNNQLSASGVATLEHFGLSLGDYIVFILVLRLVSALLCYALAVFLLWRKSDNWMAMLVSLMLMSFGPGMLSNAVRFSQWFGPEVAGRVST